MSASQWIGAVLASARPKAVAALVRYFRDLDTAEEAYQEAYQMPLRRLRTPHSSLSRKLGTKLPMRTKNGSETSLYAASVQVKQPLR